MERRKLVLIRQLFARLNFAEEVALEEEKYSSVNVRPAIRIAVGHVHRLRITSNYNMRGGLDLWWRHYYCCKKFIDRVLLHGFPENFVGQLLSDDSLSSDLSEDDSLSSDLSDDDSLSSDLSEDELDRVIAATLNECRRAKTPCPEAMNRLKTSQVGQQLECETCCVCLQKFASKEHFTILPCNHLYHSICIRRWLKDKSTCPQCRFQMETTDQEFNEDSYAKQVRTFPHIASTWKVGLEQKLSEDRCEYKAEYEYKGNTEVFENNADSEEDDDPEEDYSEEDYSEEDGPSFHVNVSRRQESQVERSSRHSSEEDDWYDGWYT